MNSNNGCKNSETNLNNGRKYADNGDKQSYKHDVNCNTLHGIGNAACDNACNNSRNNSRIHTNNGSLGYSQQRVK